MERRKFVIGLGALATGSAAAVGTGAFTSATVEGRDINVDTSGDGSAYVQFNVDDEADNDVGPNEEYASIEGSQLQLDFNDLNQSSSFEFDNVFEIQNEGTQSVDVYVSNNTTTGVDLYWGDDTGDSAEGETNSRNIGEGSAEAVGVEIDDTDTISDGTITIQADA